MANETDTSIIRREESNSTILGVSVRAWIVLIAVCGVVITHLIVTIGVMYHAIMTKDFSLVGTLTTITEPFYSVVGVGIGFYLGTKNSK